jgi:hypothetical protein
MEMSGTKYVPAPSAIESLGDKINEYSEDVTAKQQVSAILYEGMATGIRLREGESRD